MSISTALDGRRVSRATKVPGNRLSMACFQPNELPGHTHAADLAGALADLGVARPGF
jgi:hypothetical protein